MKILITNLEHYFLCIFRAPTKFLLEVRGIQCERTEKNVEKKDAVRVRSCFARAMKKKIQYCTATHSAVGEQS